MSNKKTTDLTELSSAASGDYLYIVDSSDLTDSMAGTSKKITPGNLVSAGLAETSAGVTVVLSRYGDDLSLAVAAAIAGDGKLQLGDATYTPGDIPVDGDLAIGGAGAVSYVEGAFVIPDQAITVNLLLRDIAGEKTADSFIEGTYQGAANVAIDVDGLAVYDSGRVIGLRSSGSITGSIRNVSGETLSQSGIAIGWNDYSASANWGQVLIDCVVLKDVHPDDANSHYGIICYAANSIITRGYIYNVGNSPTGTGADTEGIYTKARHSIIHGWVLEDAGEGEAYLNIKGNTRGETSAPTGYGVIAGDIVFVSNKAGMERGANLANDDLILHDVIFDGLQTFAINTNGSELDNLVAHHATAVQGNYSSGVIYCQSSGKYHHFDHVIGHDGAGHFVRFEGQSAAAHISATDLRADGFTGAAVLFKPSVDSVAEYHVARAVFDDFGANAVLYADGHLSKAIALHDVDCGDLTALGNPALDYGAGAGADRWDITNLRARVSTADATAFTVFRLNVPDGAALRIRARAVAKESSPATDQYTKEMTALVTAAAGAASIVDSDTVYEYQSTANGWNLELSAASNAIRVRVSGEAATDIDWTVVIDVEMV